MKDMAFLAFLLLARVVTGNRNPKKGVSFLTAQSCATLESHTTSSWWYSWGPQTGFSTRRGSFCSDPDTAAANARASGMDFVPMFWSSIPDIDNEVDGNLQAASYLLTFNEPEFATQANVSPQTAAEMWPQIVVIAQQYNLQLVAPYVAPGAGKRWYDDWLAECMTQHGAPCAFDFTCLHLYYQPYPCDAGVQSWACIGPNGARAVNEIERFKNAYGKPTWVTELACAPWGGGTCDLEKHTALMNQLVPILQESPDVFRYTWYTAYTAYDGTWVGNGLNELIWTRTKGKKCANTIWAGGFGDANWQIKTLDQCVAKADSKVECHQPLVLSIDDDNCYCATDACETLEDSYAAMNTYREVGIRGSNQLTSLGTNYNRICANDPNWFFRKRKRGAKRTCDWVAKRRRSRRCRRKGEDGTLAKDACHAYCGGCQ